jgi:hypothetical protein
MTTIFMMFLLWFLEMPCSQAQRAVHRDHGRPSRVDGVEDLGAVDVR